MRDPGDPRAAAAHVPQPAALHPPPGGLLLRGAAPGGVRWRPAVGRAVGRAVGCHVALSVLVGDVTAAVVRAAALRAGPVPGRARPEARPRRVRRLVLHRRRGRRGRRLGPRRRPRRLGRLPRGPPGAHRALALRRHRPADRGAGEVQSARGARSHEVRTRLARPLSHVFY